MRSKIPRKPGSLQPVLPLIPEALPSADEDKGNYISFELKTRVGAPNDSTKYKKYVRKFEEGTPHQWILLMRDLEEIWAQNSMGGGTDRASTVRALVRGESAVAFEAALQEARSDGEGELQAATIEHVEAALKSVAAVVFPHRALELQKLWMHKSMFKPRALSTRMTSAAISRINNALPVFPGATAEDKFNESDLIGLLEWSLPAKWREQFDLKGYVPSDHPRKKLIEECEAIERHIKPDSENGKTGNGYSKNSKNQKSEKSGSKGKKSEEAFSHYCKEHGKNSTHDTKDCYTLKNRAKNSTKGNNPSERSFTNKGFRKELNLLSKKSTKTDVLDMYESAIKKERAKLAKRKSKKLAKDASNEDSDSDVSVHLLEDNGPLTVKPKLRASKVKSAIKRSRETHEKGVTTEEEKAYQQKVAWLQDKGDSDVEAMLKDSDGESE